MGSNEIAPITSPCLCRSMDALFDIFHDRGKLRTLRDSLERGEATP
jgi:hypothetical protein